MVYVALFVIGLCFGSFVNALVWRIHEQAVLIKKRQASKKKLSKTDTQQLEKLSISKGRSMCLHCGHELTAQDLIPVVSWLILRGRCRYCRHAIPDTPLAELLVPLLFIVSYVFWPFNLSTEGGWWAFGLWLAALVLFVALTLYDIRWYLLPNRMVLPLIGIAVLYVAVRAIANTDFAIVGVSILSGLFLAGIFYALFALSNGKWIGGGDVKLALALGLFVGTPLAAMLVMFVASLGGLIVSLPGVLGGRLRAKSRVPFGPFLLAGTFVTVLFGTAILNWYFGLLSV